MERGFTITDIALLLLGFSEAAFGLRVVAESFGGGGPLLTLTGTLLLGCGAVIILAGLNRVGRGLPLFGAIGLGMAVMLALLLRIAR